MIRNRKIAITGGAGFIGSHLAERLSKDNDVIVIDDLSTGNLHSIEDFEDRIEFDKTSVLDRKGVLKLFKDVDLVFHLAALISVIESVEDPIRYAEVNILGSLNVLCAARDRGVQRVVYASSCALYGDTTELPISEDHPIQILSPYGLSKATAESYFDLSHELYGLETVVLRYFNVYGPRQNPDSPYAPVIPKFIRQLLEGKEITVYGDGNQTRDFTFVEDVVSGTILAAERKKASGETFNIASGKGTSVGELVECLERVMKTGAKVHHDAPRAGEIKHSYANVSKARRILGYEPMVSLEEGLRKTVESFR